MANLDKKISALTDGDPVVGTDLLVVARDGDNYKVTAQSIADLGGGGATLACRVESAANQTTIVTQRLVVVYGTVVQDDGGFWNAATPNRLIAPEEGWYTVSCGWCMSSGGSEGNRILRLLKNYDPSEGTAYDKMLVGSSIRNSAGSLTWLNGTAITYMQANDWVIVDAYRSDNSVGTIDIIAGPYTFLSMAKL